MIDGVADPLPVDALGFVDRGDAHPGAAVDADVVHVALAVVVEDEVAGHGA